MKTLHTPGPWLAPETLTDNYVWATKDGTSVVVAKVNIQPSFNSRIRITDVEAFSNARLIAAAPELLDALEKLIGFIGPT